MANNKFAHKTFANVPNGTEIYEFSDANNEPIRKGVVMGKSIAKIIIKYDCGNFGKYDITTGKNEQLGTFII